MARSGTIVRDRGKERSIGFSYTLKNISVEMWIENVSISTPSKSSCSSNELKKNIAEFARIKIRAA